MRLLFELATPVFPHWQVLVGGGGGATVGNGAYCTQGLDMKPYNLLHTLQAIKTESGSRNAELSCKSRNAGLVPRPRRLLLWSGCN